MALYKSYYYYYYYYKIRRHAEYLGQRSKVIVRTHALTVDRSQHPHHKSGREIGESIAQNFRPSLSSPVLLLTRMVQATGNVRRRRLSGHLAAELGLRRSGHSSSIAAPRR